MGRLRDWIDREPVRLGQDHENLQVDQIMAVLEEHTPGYGIMASWTHWAYGDPADKDRPRWFAYCAGDSRTGEKGCGWDSKPNLWHDRAGAQQAMREHLAQMIREVL